MRSLFRTPNGYGDTARCTFTWSLVEHLQGIPPCPRSRHSAVCVSNTLNRNSTENEIQIIVMGGTTHLENRRLKPQDTKSGKYF